MESLCFNPYSFAHTSPCHDQRPWFRVTRPALNVGFPPANREGINPALPIAADGKLSVASLPQPVFQSANPNSALQRAHLRAQFSKFRRNDKRRFLPSDFINALTTEPTVKSWTLPNFKEYSAGPSPEWINGEATIFWGETCSLNVVIFSYCIIKELCSYWAYYSIDLLYLLVPHFRLILKKYKSLCNNEC